MLCLDKSFCYFQEPVEMFNATSSSPWVISAERSKKRIAGQSRAGSVDCREDGLALLLEPDSQLFEKNQQFVFDFEPEKY